MSAFISGVNAKANLDGNDAPFGIRKIHEIPYGKYAKRQQAIQSQLNLEFNWE